MRKTNILTLSCEDRPGLVADVATFLAQNGCNIRDSQQFNDILTNKFFMRVQYEIIDPDITLATLRSRFAPLAETHRMDWKMRDGEARERVLLMVSKFDHCLGDLLSLHESQAGQCRKCHHQRPGSRSCCHP